MYSYLSSWFFSPVEEEIEVSAKTKQDRHLLLKEVKQFDKKILLAVPQSLEEFVGEKKPSKIFTFKRTEKKNDKKRSRNRKRRKSSNQ